MRTNQIRRSCAYQQSIVYCRPAFADLPIIRRRCSHSHEHELDESLKIPLAFASKSASLRADSPGSHLPSVRIGSERTELTIPDRNHENDLSSSERFSRSHSAADTRTPISRNNRADADDARNEAIQLSTELVRPGIDETAQGRTERRRLHGGDCDCCKNVRQL